MFAFRLLIFFLLAYVFIVIIYKFLLPNRIERLKRQEDPDQGQELVLCSHCQSYVPKSEAVFSRGYYFCREECARLFVMRHNQEVSKVDNNGSSR
jgi:YHS domain-containing protein